MKFAFDWAGADRNQEKKMWLKFSMRSQDYWFGLLNKNSLKLKKNQVELKFYKTYVDEKFHKDDLTSWKGNNIHTPFRIKNLENSLNSVWIRNGVKRNILTTKFISVGNSNLEFS